MSGLVAVRASGRSAASPRPRPTRAAPSRGSPPRWRVSGGPRDPPRRSPGSPRPGYRHPARLADLRVRRRPGDGVRVIESWIVAIVFVGAVTLGVLRVAQRLDARE